MPLSSLLPLVPVTPPQLLWTCVGTSTDVVKRCLPSKTLRRIVQDVAALTRPPPETLIESLTRGMNEATTLAEYEACTVDLDHLQGHEQWKKEKESIETSYYPHEIERQMLVLQKAAMISDVGAMQHLLRTRLSRDVGGMNMLRLYKHSWFGTKFLIDEYINTVLETIRIFTEASIKFNLPTREVVAYQQSMEDALMYFGKSALTLSGGAVLGMKHIGVVKTLWEADLLPNVISGASAGSIVAAIVATQTDESMQDVLETFPYSDLAVFDPTGTGKLGWLYQRARTFYHTGAFFESDNLKRVMRKWLGDLTFREAHNKTGRVLNICISSARNDEPMLLNYLTAPDVFIWSAVCASCAVPGVFAPANIYEKDATTGKVKLWFQNAHQTFLDGSLDHDLPMRKLAEMFNVNFFIVSQVNPHVRAFLEPEEVFRGRQPSTSFPYHGLLQSVRMILKREITHRVQDLTDLGLPQGSVRWASLFNQQYTGDINIFPHYEYGELLNLMTNPTPEFMMQAMADGERATWPKMCRIRNCVAIELELAKAIKALKERAIFGPEARAAREKTRKENQGEARRGRSARPAFLRRRSLSIESPTNGDSRPNGVSSLRVRRNASLGSLNIKPLTMTSLTPRTTPYLSPQFGFDLDMTSDSLVMTTVGEKDP